MLPDLSRLAFARALQAPDVSCFPCKVDDGGTTLSRVHQLDEGTTTSNARLF